MKRFIYLFVGCALFSISCSVKEENPTDLYDSFHVALETIASETKSFADEDGKVLWNNGDVVSIFEKVSYQAKYQYTGGNGTSGGELVKVEESGTTTGVPVNYYYASFPYESSNGLDNNENLVLRIHNQQVNGYKSFGPTDNLMVAISDDNHFRFKNVCGYLVFRLYGDGDVASLTFRGNNNERIAGDVKVTASTDYNDDTKPSSTVMYGREYPGSETFTEVTLDCVDPEYGAVSLVDNKEQPEEFWLVLPPMTFTNGFTFVVTDTQGRTFTKSTSSSYTVERNTKKAARSRVVFTTAVESVSLDANEVSLTVGETRTLVATVLPENATDKSVTWSSSDQTVATVDANGKVTAVKDGSATITVTTVDGSKTASCAVSVSPVTATGVEVTPASIGIYVGETQTLTATVKPTNAANKTVTWSSSNTTIATVNSNGVVTGVKAGSVTITATANDGSGAKGTCSVTVSNIAVSGISLNKQTLSLVKGTTETLTATITPSNATEQTVTWSSSNTTVATVNGGTVTAKAVGTATITAKAGNKSATCTVTVTPILVSGISLSPSATNINTGASVTISATVTPSNADDKTVTWSSSNTAIATVSSNGVVTGVKAGSATITATAHDGSGVKGTCSVTVKNPSIEPTSISLSETFYIMAFNDTYQLEATVYPSNATNKTVTWSVNSSYASVSNTGLVTSNALSNTQVTVTAKTYNGKSATCTINIIPTKDYPIYYTGSQELTADLYTQTESMESTDIGATYGSIYDSESQSGIRYLGAPTAYFGIPSSTTTQINQKKTITSITIPSQSVTIGVGPLSGCSALESISLPETLTKITSFSGCSKLTSFIVPVGVTSIGDLTFSNCSSLSSISFLGNITSIGYSAFENCSSLTTLTIPESVTSIGKWAFRGCSNLTSFTQNALSQDGRGIVIGDTFCGLASSGITSYSVPSGVKTIIDCIHSTSISEITLPATVQTIECDFHLWESLKLTIKATTPPSITNSDFLDTDLTANDIQIIVPAQSLSTYQSKWSAYKKFIKAGNF